MTTEENRFAGQGPVLLDIGGDVGALVVTMPPELEGIEVEIRPAGAAAVGHQHDHGRNRDRHDHEQPPDHEHAGHHLPHVAVIARRVDSVAVHSLVFPELVEGEYELYQRPAGPVELAVRISGGEVTEAAWPGTTVDSP
jgi:hypothetical protein